MNEVIISYLSWIKEEFWSYWNISHLCLAVFSRVCINNGSPVASDYEHKMFSYHLRFRNSKGGWQLSMSSEEWEFTKWPYFDIFVLSPIWTTITTIKNPNLNSNYLVCLWDFVWSRWVFENAENGIREKNREKEQQTVSKCQLTQFLWQLFSPEADWNVERSEMASAISGDVLSFDTS